MKWTMLLKLCMLQNRVHKQVHEQYKMVSAAQALCLLHKMHRPAQMVLVLFGADPIAPMFGPKT